MPFPLGDEPADPGKDLRDAAERPEKALQLEDDEEGDPGHGGHEAERGGRVHPAGELEQEQAEEEPGDQKERRGEGLGRFVDEDAGDAFLQRDLTPDEKGPGGVAAHVGRGEKRIQGIADDLGPEEAPERDPPEIGGLDDMPGPGLEEKPAEAEADDDQEPGPEADDCIRGPWPRPTFSTRKTRSSSPAPLRRTRTQRGNRRDGRRDGSGPTSPDAMASSALPSGPLVIDVDPEKAARVPGPGLAPFRQDPDASGEGIVAPPLACLERLEQGRRAEEGARIEGVVLGDVLPDGGDMSVDVPHPGHVVEVDVGVAARPAVHGQDDLIAADRPASQSVEKGRIEDVVGHDEQEPLPGQGPRLEDREAVLLLPLLVPDGRDRDPIELGLRPEMILDVVPSYPVTTTNSRTPAARAASMALSMRAFPPTSRSGLLGALAASRLPRPAAMMTHFSSRTSFWHHGSIDYILRDDRPSIIRRRSGPARRTPGAIWRIRISSVIIWW